MLVHGEPHGIIQ